MTSPDKPQQIAQALVQYEGPLLRYATGLCGHGDIARDAVQDAFIKLWKLDAEEQPQQLRPWLYTVVRNRVYEILRKDKRMYPTDPACLPQNHANLQHPSEEMKAAEEAHQLQRLVAGLPERERELIRLKYQDGLSYQEMSGVTGLSISHIGVILHKTLKALRHQAGRDDGLGVLA